MSFWNRIENPAEPLPRSPAEPAAEAPPARTEPPARAEPAVRPEPAAAAREPAPAQDSLRLGRGVRLEGKLTFSGTVRIDATFQGSIVTDGVLVVGDQASVDADIACGTVVIEGRVNGNVVAKESVELRSTARLKGDIEAPALAIERGASFEGASRRPAAGASASARKAVAAPAHGAH